MLYVSHFNEQLFHRQIEVYVFNSAALLMPQQQQKKEKRNGKKKETKQYMQCTTSGKDGEVMGVHMSVIKKDGSINGKVK